MAGILKETELKSAILAELRGRTVLTLALSGEAGPHAVSLMYAHDAFDIFWLSDPKTRHSKILALNPAASVTIAAQNRDFRKIKGLQMSGKAHRLTNTEEAAAFDLLVARYPFLNKFSAGKLARHLGAAAVYLYRPVSVTLIDNTHRFGFKQTLKLTNGSGHFRHIP